MKKLFLLSLATLFMAGMAIAQEPTGKADAFKGKSRGEDPNILTEKRVNGDDSESSVVQTSEKGAATRGSICTCTLDNWTAWYIDFYVDGNYEGYVSKWSEGSVNVLAGETRVYAVAEFTDGSRVTYGPVTRNCQESFELTVYDDEYEWSVR